MTKKCCLLAVFLLAPALAGAQTFSSGSTGENGALDLRNCGLAKSLVQLPESGVLNYTTVFVDSSCILAFRFNQRNTPVTLLAQGEVRINGEINVGPDDGTSNSPGPGGFYGGGYFQNGFGPGGGLPGNPGRWVGPLSLVPPIGGSGGGGQLGAGGGGGGAIVIASSGTIYCDGRIFAHGGTGPSDRDYNGGSGGAIRLVANAIVGSCRLEALNWDPGGSSGLGLIRLEAPIGQLSYTGTANPPAVLSPVNPVVVPTSTTAALSISSIGGYPVLSDAGVTPGTVDVVLPRALTDPIEVVVQGRNVPVGTQVQMNISGSSGASFTPGTLTGSYEASSATLAVTGLNRSGESHLFVYATFDVPLGASMLNVSGPDRVAKLRLEASPGKPSTLAFLREDGSRIDPAKLPAAFVGYFKD